MAGPSGVSTLGSGSKFVDGLQEQFGLINDSLSFCHQKLDQLTGPIPTATEKAKGVEATAFNQAFSSIMRIRESIQCLADRMKDL